MNAEGTVKMQSIYYCVGNDPTVKLELGVVPLAFPKPRVPLTLGRRGSRSDLRIWFLDAL